MNYLEAINQFWQLRRSKRITNMQADLYFFLLQESNSRNWENPFQCSNGLVCTSICVTEKSMIDARNVLQQLGLIEFERGVTKQKAPVYFLCQYWNKVSNPVSKSVSIQGSNPVSNPGSNEANIYTKQNKTETKHSKSHLPPNGGAKKKKEVQYWAALVKCWFDFYDDKFSAGSSFDAVKAKALKSIISRLKHVAEQKAKGHKTPEIFEWTEKYAVHALNYFFQKAWEHDTWLQANFELPVLSQKFDSITNSKGKQNGAHKQVAQKDFSTTDYSKF